MKLDGILADIDGVLKIKDERREEVITLSREIIRKAGSAVFSTHKKDEGGRAASLEAARRALERALEICRSQPEFLFVGPLPQAFQEFAEASILSALVEGGEVPSPKELKVPVESYVTGLADAVSEMRRYALDSLRRDDFGEAERALTIMDDTYSVLRKLDYPRAVIPNLRSKVDAIRRVLEATRGDVTLSHQGLLIRGSIDRALRTGMADSWEGKGRGRGGEEGEGEGKGKGEGRGGGAAEGGVEKGIGREGGERGEETEKRE